MSESRLRYKAGAASVCYTPDEPFWLAGYAVRTKPASGKISDLFVSALAFEDEFGERLVIVSAEIISINPEVANRVAEVAHVRHGLSRRQLLIAATHTHYAPEFRQDKRLFFHIPDEYGAKVSVVADKLVAAIAQAINEAMARLEPVQLFARKTSATFAHNRRRRGVKAGKPSTEDTLDQDVPVLDCVDAAGNRKAIVFGYACHCTTIPPEDSRYCGDWAGFAKQQLEQANPGATALFIPGPGADQDPEPRGSLELSLQYGEQLATSVQKSLEQTGVEILGPIKIGWEDVQLSLQPIAREAIETMLTADDPPQNVKARFLIDQLERGEEFITSYVAPLQVVHVGEQLLLVALSGEPVIDWAHKIKGEAGRTSTGIQQLVWVAGYCNDVFDYVPTRRIQAEGGYEGGRANLWNWIPTPFTDDVEDRVTAAVERLIK